MSTKICCDHLKNVCFDPVRNCLVQFTSALSNPVAIFRVPCDGDADPLLWARNWEQPLERRILKTVNLPLCRPYASSRWWVTHPGKERGCCMRERRVPKRWNASSEDSVVVSVVLNGPKSYIITSWKSAHRFLVSSLNYDCQERMYSAFIAFA